MTPIVFYCEEDGSAPLLDWFDEIPQKARLACLARIELLKEHGHRLRRPHVEYLRDGIYELRAKVQKVNYRMLYFFHGQKVIVLSHGITKQRAEVPSTEIEYAKRRAAAFADDPEKHTYKET